MCYIVHAAEALNILNERKVSVRLSEVE